MTKAPKCSCHDKGTCLACLIWATVAEHYGAAGMAYLRLLGEPEYVSVHSKSQMKRLDAQGAVIVDCPACDGHGKVRLTGQKVLGAPIDSKGEASPSDIPGRV